MIALAFPLIALLVLFLVTVPLLTLASKATLVLRRRRVDSLPTFASPLDYLLIVAPVALPLTWFASAGLHQSEPRQALLACLHVHAGAPLCLDAAFFVAAILLIVLAALSTRAWRSRRASPQATALPRHDPAQARLERLAAASSLLAHARLMAVDNINDDVRTRGWFRPVIEVHHRAALSFEDDELLASLLHEIEHFHRLDPLRYLVASVALSLNPMAHLLRPELARWRLAREAACDLEAVCAGANPLALAQALVKASRPHGHRCHGATAARLGACTTFATLEARVRLLLNYADALPPHRHHRGTWHLTSAAVGLLVLSPHLFGSLPLDLLHHRVELLAHHLPSLLF